MAVVAGPGAGALRARVWFERREALDPNGPGDGAGNFEGDWKKLCGARDVGLEPRRGGAEVVADRLQGVSIFDLWVIFDEKTSLVRAGDRVVDEQDPNRQFAVLWAEDIDRRRRWILMQVQEGKAT